MKAILLISIVALTGNFTFSQFQDINWVFGDSIGLNFSTEPPSFFETSILTYETNACISDSIGNLLFYTNGGQIWNKNHTLMSNGSGLDIPGYPLGNVTQGAIIIPVPLNENIYYLIQKSYPYKYSVIDLNLEGSLGKVIEKNIQLQSGFNPYNQSQKMNLIKHGNGRDWWLVFPAYPLDGGVDGFGNPLIIYLFLINPYTIQLNTTFEGVIYEEQNSITTPGQCKFTLDGSMFGMAHGKSIILYLFDRCSGIFSHYYTIDSIFTGNPSDCINGIEFSLDGTKLYATKSGGVGNGISKLYQYDLAATDIKASQVILRQDSLGYMYSSLQLAPNGKIYCAMPHDGVEYYSYDAPQNLSLSVINNPNEAGIACDYEHLAQYLGGKRVTYGLPNMPNYNLGVLPKSACDTLGTAINNIQASSAFHIYPNPANEYIFISSDTYKTEKCLLELYNSTGTLANRYADVVVNETIHLPKLNEGVYLAVITTSSGKQFSEKLVIAE